MIAVRIAIGLAFAAVALSILAGGHYYLVSRLVLEPGIDAPLRGVLIGCVVACGGLLLAQPVFERLLGPPYSRLVSWPASVWMGAGFLLVVLLGASDLLLWLVGGTAFAAEFGETAAQGAATTRALAVVTVAAVAGAAGMISALSPPGLERVEIRPRDWPAALDGFRLVQISDIHIGPILDRRFARHLVERCNALDADLIAVTGDLVDGAVRHLEDEVAPFAELRARHGVYFVTGNHDHYSGADPWVDCVRRLGMHPLRNEHVTIGDGPARFVLAGVDDHRGGFADGQREDLEAALEGADATLAVVLLAHDPSTFKKAAGRVGLQLSGHTHAGQIWPFRYLVRLAIPFVAGRYTRAGSELYVSRGTGFWGPPMRLFAPAEITEITLRAA